MSRLKMTADAHGTVKAGYDCACGCHPEIAYRRGATVATEGCCCGNQFLVGPSASSLVRPREGFKTEVEHFQAPWGENLEAAWSIGPSGCRIAELSGIVVPRLAADRRDVPAENDFICLTYIPPFDAAVGPNRYRCRQATDCVQITGSTVSVIEHRREDVQVRHELASSAAVIPLVH